MVDVEFGQMPFPITHRKTFTPNPSPVIPVLGELGDVGTPAPETKLHVPVPTEGVFPFMVAVVAHTV